MSNKKIVKTIGNTVALSTILALAFIVVYSFLTCEENNYVFFIKKDVTYNIMLIIAFCLIPLAVSIKMFYNSRKKYSMNNENNPCNNILYLCSIVSICLLSIINFSYVFLNTCWVEDVKDITIIPDNEFMLLYIIVPLCVFIIILSIILRIKLYIKNKNADSYHFDICMLFNITNLIVCFFFEGIVFICILFVFIFYELISNI